jgi:hypothetical protein
VDAHLVTFLEYAIDTSTTDDKSDYGDLDGERRKRARKDESDSEKLTSDGKEGGEVTLKGDIRIFYSKLFQPSGNGANSRIVPVEPPSGIAIDSMHLRMGSQWVASENSKSWNEVRHLLEEYAERVMDPLKLATWPKDKPSILVPGAICRITGIKAKKELNGM